MQTKYVQTVITYDIQDDDDYGAFARNTLRERLLEMNYQDGDNQSTMIHELKIPKRTLRAINELCNDVKFNRGDEISIYSIVLPDENRPPLIEKNRFLYNRRNNRFE